MKERIWYAVMQDANDDDWGTGSENLEEAKKMLEELKEDHPEAYIAVISDNVSAICIKIIK